MRKNLIVKRICCVAPLIAACLFAAGCGNRTDTENAYDVYETTSEYLSRESGLITMETDDMFASDLCVGGVENSEAFFAESDCAKTEAVMLPDDREITYAKNIYQKRYPASTTKILTAYLALKYGDLDQTVTVSEHAIDILEDGSSLCNLRAGDQYTLRDLLYGLLLESGNDAANVIAETVGGSQEAFVEMMNEEAAALGATRSHFVNPHGMPDDDHYTTAYDLYLIFEAALQYDEFVDIISTDRYTVTYTDEEGAQWQQEWVSTDGYLSGEYEVPEGVTVIGGKTGTTDAAGYCLALYSTNSAGSPVISIVMLSDSHDDLYACMTGLIEQFGN